MLNPARRRRRDRGFALPLMALLLVSMLGVAGLVVDLGAWQVEASRIQQAADAAALAGVVRLPDGDTAAAARARAIAADNGFDDADPDVDVNVTPLGEESLEVEIVVRNVSQYFTGVFRGPSSITRRSTAQYVQPVPLGSPRNYLGTSDLASIGTTADGVENFFLAVSGHCSRREYGDRITPKAMSNPSSGHSCAGTLPNPEHDERGYLFGVSVPAGASGVELQMFDIPVCTNGGAAVDVFGEQLAPFEVEVTVRTYNPLDPYSAADELYKRSFTGQNGTTGLCQFGTPDAEDQCEDGDHLRECWFTLDTLATGEYTVQVDPELPDGVTDRDERHNSFSLRAKHTGSWTPCTSDIARQGDATATPAYSPTCPQVYGLEHLPIYAQGTSSPLFYLASIDDRHAGKTLQVTLFDSAEGASTISLIDPAGNPAVFDWEILCADGSPTTSSCTGENQPAAPGRTGPATASLNVAGTVGTTERTFSNNIQNGKYSDRLIRLTYKLPVDFATAYGNETWWKIRYGGSFSGDRTTWSVKLLGDPVRLIPNTPPTTAPPGP